MVAGHVDALTARLKPVSTKKTSAGYVQLGVAPYAGALNSTWWDRDLGIGGRVLVKDPKTGKIVTKLVKLGWPSTSSLPYYTLQEILMTDSCSYPYPRTPFRDWYDRSRE
jgi:aminopeptidase I